jgi:hypothetical protein
MTADTPHGELADHEMLNLNQRNFMRNAATKLPEIRQAAQEVAGCRGSALQMLASWCTPSDVLELLDHIAEKDAEIVQLRAENEKLRTLLEESVDDPYLNHKNTWLERATEALSDD